MIKNIKKMAMIGILMLAGGAYTESSLNNSSDKRGDYKKIENQYEENSKLEIILKEEREEFSKPFYLTPDSLNVCIKQAYAEVKKWPDEFDKRLFRLMLKQESQYNVYAKNKSSGARGLGQIMPITYENFRLDKFEKFRDSVTGKIDTLSLEKELFNPVENIGISLEALNYFSNYCKQNHSGWDTLNLEDKRRTILYCYNAGQGRVFEKDKELPRETINYADSIMTAYHNPKVKVKL